MRLKMYWEYEECWIIKILGHGGSGRWRAHSPLRDMGAHGGGGWWKVVEGPQSTARHGSSWWWRVVEGGGGPTVHCSTWEFMGSAYIHGIIMHM